MVAAPPPGCAPGLTLTLMTLPALGTATEPILAWVVSMTDADRIAPKERTRLDLDVDDFAGHGRGHGAYLGRVRLVAQRPGRRPAAALGHALLREVGHLHDARDAVGLEEHLPGATNPLPRETLSHVPGADLQACHPHDAWGAVGLEERLPVTKTPQAP